MVRAKEAVIMQDFGKGCKAVDFSFMEHLSPSSISRNCYSKKLSCRRRSSQSLCDCCIPLSPAPTVPPSLVSASFCWNLSHQSTNMLLFLPLLGPLAMAIYFYLLQINSKFPPILKKPALFLSPTPSVC